MGHAQPLQAEHRFQKLIDLSVKGRYCPFTDLDWQDHPSEDVPWMPYELCTLYDTKTWSELTNRQRLRLSQLEMMNVFSVTLGGEHEIQKDLMPILFNTEYSRESSYLSIFLREEYDHAAMFWRFCNTYRGDIYRTKHARLHKWDDKLQHELNGFAQTLVAEEILTYFNYVISRSPEIPSLVREINNKHHADESRHIVMGRQMVAELWTRFKAQRSAVEIDAYREYVRRYVLFFISSLASVDVYREADISRPLDRKIAFENQRSKNVDEYPPAKRLLAYLARIDLYNPSH